ncbi:MAG: hypothetical protein ACYC1D_17210, partial [Acidimicrobiales bacterium]
PAEPIRLAEVTGAATEMLGPLAGRVTFSVPAGLPLIDADATLLARAVANLLRSALARAAHDASMRLEGQFRDGRVEVHIIEAGAGAGRLVAVLSFPVRRA